MGFLAQLRQSKSNFREDGVRLSYLLSLRDGKAFLRLGLSAVEAGRMQKSPTPYKIQTSHLQFPPAFFHAEDAHLLAVLQSRFASWQGDTDAMLTEQTFEVLRQGPLQRSSLFGLVNRQWQALKNGPTAQAQLSWKIQRDGKQRLAWSLPATAIAFQVDDQHFSLDMNGQLQHLEPAEQHSRVNAHHVGMLVDPDDVMSYRERQSGALLEPHGNLPMRLDKAELSANLEPILYCWSEGGQDFVQLLFRYHTSRYCVALPVGPESKYQLWNGSLLWEFLRLSEQESRTYNLLKSNLLKSFALVDAGLWSAKNTDLWRKLFLQLNTVSLSEPLRCEFHPEFRHQYLVIKDWSINVKKTEGEDNFDLNIYGLHHGQEFDVFSLLNQLVDSAALEYDQDGYVELRYEQNRLLIPQSTAGLLAKEFADWLTWEQHEQGMPMSQLYRVQALSESFQANTTWHGDQAVLSLAQTLGQTPQQFDLRSVKVRAELRAYQWAGVYWLQHISRTACHGLLADDMGLGKTLQTLTHLSVEFANKPHSKPALIIAPTSLISNWAAELTKFCPHLDVLIVHGANRERLWRKRHSAQVLITSYPLLVRDMDHWRNFALSWLILDEAQVIKNPKTQVRKMVVQLQCSHRLCLSGTPVENHLAEFWSVMDFLNPGIFGSLKQFKDYYQKPIEEQLDTSRMDQLLQRVAPLMLRRTKDQVAKDLPQKTVVIKRVNLSDRQMAFYDEVKQSQWEQLESDLHGDLPQGQKHIKLLTAITRVRQVCCDPKLLDQQHIESAKTKLCIEMIEELVDEGRFVLVFSQFTNMLSILEHELNGKAIPYFTLTGKTHNRSELVEAFQRGERPVFLISLKAGGVGLNLTRADTVIHFDPWWNIAAEEQASDRAHRIGQTQPVFVYKLVAESTIEEKILQLQDSKAWLADRVNQQAQSSGREFSLNLRDLIKLWDKDE